jgi:hypothetical protein
MTYIISATAGTSTISYEKYIGSVTVSFNAQNNYQGNVEKSNKTIDIVSENMAEIIGSNQNDTFMLYELSNNAVRVVRGTSVNSIANGVVDIDVIDLSFSQSGINLTLSTSSSAMDLILGQGTWQLISIEGAKLTNFDDTVILSGNGSYRVDALSQTALGQDSLDYTAYNSIDYSSFIINISLASETISIFKQTRNQADPSYTDIISNMELIILGDTDDSIFLIGNLTGIKVNTLRAIDTGAGTNALNISRIVGDVSFDINNLSISSSALGISITNISSISGSSSSKTTYKITEGITSNIYTLQGDTSTAAIAILDFNSLTNTALVFDFNLIDSNRVSYLNVKESGVDFK